MDLIQVDPVFNLYDPGWPLRTWQPQLPPAKFVFAEGGPPRGGDAVDRLDGVHRLRQRGEPLDPLPDVRVHSYCEIEDSILFPGAVVHRHSRVRHAIVDRGWRSPAAPSSATTRPRTAGATPFPREGSWS